MTGPSHDNVSGNRASFDSGRNWAERNSLSGRNELPLERAISLATPANNGESQTQSSGQSRGKSRA